MSGYTRATNNLTLAQLNEPLDALELQAQKQFGRGILSGLTISDGGGLTLSIAAGALMGLKCVSIAATSLLLAAASTLWVWIDEEGDLQTTASFSDPGGTNVCLGKVITGASTISSIDVSSSSGRMSLFRWTSFTGFNIGESLIAGDIGAGTLKFLTAQAQVMKGNGQSPAYGRAAVVFPSDANYTTSATERECRTLSVTGTISATRNVVLDLTDGAEHVVYNGTTGGFSIQVIGATGTGITIANGKTAIVRCDGTNWLRVTADNP